MKKGKRFEETTYKFVKKFNPDKEINKNVFIEGKLSQVKREVDVQLVDPKSFNFLALECKDHSRPIDVGAIEQFNTKLTDIGAIKGGFVSNSPYTKAAQNMADALGIDLLHIVDTSDKKIKTKIYATTSISDVFVKNWRVQISSTAQFLLGGFDQEHITLVNEEGGQLTAFELFANLWNHGELAEIPESYKYSMTEGINILSLDGKIAPLTEAAFFYTVEQKHYIGSIELIEATGIYNVANKTFQTNHITTEEIVPFEVEKKWKQVTEEDLKKTQITFGTSVKSMFKL